MTGAMSTPDYYLGIDFGTTGARAVAIDRSGKPAASCAVALESAVDHATAGLWRETLFTLIAGLPPVIRQHMRAIAIDGTSGTVLLCDQHNTPLLPPLLYNDSRAAEEARALARMAPAGHVTLSPSSTLAKLAWLAKQPEFPAARYLSHQADWLAAQLHGRAGISDYHNSLKLGYDPGSMAYPDWLLAQPGTALVPRVVPPGTALGRIMPEIALRLGTSTDCRIRAGTTDSIAAFLASGAAEPGIGVTSLGSTLAIKLLSTNRVDASEYGVYSHRLGNLWLAGGASNTGGAVLRTFFTDEDLARLSTLIDSGRPSPLDYYPLPAPGERFPVNDPALPPRLAPRPDNDVAFLHGLLEGIARIEALGYQRLAELGASPLSHVLTAGGGARNAPWTAIRERLLGVPISRSIHDDAAYGAALLAARGENLLRFVPGTTAS